MNIIPSKKSQFSPVVLYLPGHEPEIRIKESAASNTGRDPIALTVTSATEPELWKIYRRLAKPAKPTKPQKCSAVPPAFDIPAKGAMKCMCYENLMKLITEHAYIPPPQLFRCSIRRGQSQNVDSVFPSWTKRAMVGFRCNEELQLPLSTLIVRWQLKRAIPSYDLRTLRCIFSHYGGVRHIRQLSPNSCLVVFESLEPACHVMQSRFIGDPMNKIHCAWWHQSMGNKVIRATTKGVRVKTDFYKLK